MMIDIPINPYIAGNPVGNTNAFVGRANILQRVLQMIRRPQDNAIVLYGQRRIGKTSILGYLEHWLPKQGLYHPIYFDLQARASAPLAQVLYELARTIAASLGHPLPKREEISEESFRNRWLPTCLDNMPTGSSLILLFDEFDVLVSPQMKTAAQTFFPYLQALINSDLKRLQFVFAIGRNIDDITNIMLSLFKGTDSIRVSLLDEADTTELIRLSSQNGTLFWSDEAVSYIWHLTNGHPFLTQQLCSHLWEETHYNEPVRQEKVIQPSHVEAIIDKALDASRNSLEWLWDGLGPAERIVISALAAAGADPMTQEELAQLLQESGVRVLLPELQDAPQVLQGWDVLELIEDKYRFRVEMLRRWIVDNKPLRRVKRDNLDLIESSAHAFHQEALVLYREERLSEAAELLYRVLDRNPNHVGAVELLARILLTQNNWVATRQELERLYEYQPTIIRSYLIEVILRQAQSASEDEEQLTLYNDVLEINPENLQALTAKQRIWRKRGDVAFQQSDFATALNAYKSGQLPDMVEAVKTYQKTWFQLAQLEMEGRYQQAIELGRALEKRYPQHQHLSTYLAQLEAKEQLVDWYERALGAMQNNDMDTARELLVKVISMDATFGEATRYLHKAVTGIDVVELQQQVDALSKQQEQNFLELLSWFRVEQFLEKESAR